jgi:hypothetical protein
MRNATDKLNSRDLLDMPADGIDAAQKQGFGTPCLLL